MVACAHIDICGIQNRRDIVRMYAVHGKADNSVVLFRLIASLDMTPGICCIAVIARVVSSFSRFRTSSNPTFIR